jgi:hypothetical protein
MLGRCAKVLDRPAGGIVKCGRGMHRPARIAEELAGKEYQVRLTRFDDGVRLGGLSDEADRRGWDCSFGADSGGEPDLEAGANRDFGVGDLPSGGNINQVDSVLAK